MSNSTPLYINTGATNCIHTASECIKYLTMISDDEYTIQLSDCTNEESGTATELDNRVFMPYYSITRNGKPMGSHGVSHIRSYNQGIANYIRDCLQAVSDDRYSLVITNWNDKPVSVITSSIDNWEV